MCVWCSEVSKRETERESIGFVFIIIFQSYFYHNSNEINFYLDKREREGAIRFVLDLLNQPWPHNTNPTSRCIHPYISISARRLISKHLQCL